MACVVQLITRLDIGRLLLLETTLILITTSHLLHISKFISVRFESELTIIRSHRGIKG